MLLKFKRIWTDYGFEIVLGLCLAFFLIFTIYNKLKGKNGTVSSNKYYFIPKKSRKKISHGRRHTPPKESKGEAECRRVLHYLFQKPFPTTRPNFLRNPVTGGNFNLELDCYNHELRLAVEYNGIQHYKYTPFFHKNKEHFLNQKYRDDMKRRLCRENNIRLIEVPYLIKLPEIKAYIEKKCKEYGYKV